MPIFRVYLTRLVEEHCSVYVRAATAEEAQTKALDDELPSSSVWEPTTTEAHSYSAEAEPTAPDTVQTPAERPQDATPTVREACIIGGGGTRACWHRTRQSSNLRNE